MTGEAILKACKGAIGELKRLSARLSRLEECAVSVSSPIGHTGGRSGVSDRVGSFAADIDECKRAIEARKKRYNVELLAACNLVDTLPEPESGVVYRFYVSNQTVSAIAATLKYTQGYVKQLKRQGLDKIAQLDESEIDKYVPEWYRLTGCAPASDHGGTEK